MKKNTLYVVLLVLLSLIMFAACEKSEHYDHSTCVTLLNKHNYLKEISKQGYDDSVAVYTSMEWKSNNVDILTYCRYYVEINHITNP